LQNFTKYLCSFTRLSEESIAALERNIESFELDKNHVLVREGQICRYLYFVERGLLKQFYNDHDKEIIDYFASENKIVCGIGSFFKQKPGNKIIKTMEPSMLSAISYKNLESLFKEYHNIEKVGRLIAMEAFILMEERIYSLQFHSAKKRYHNLMKYNPGILQRASLGEIASYLGITQVTLSRIRGQK
jgi:CRP-like cAMP-binding protein